ncbi:hypothetical protein SLEP1_g22632 [Rubroshorea leprosula]|uniref:Uncharacterized protein n=1 Tax=Rubroshorea leprosula TaxID=152421 RepID=A0AAV5JJ02_9ROSI|nr:hypothetical protein SLEP1_g22632 [Rubroshorea leprosula]
MRFLRQGTLILFTDIELKRAIQQHSFKIAPGITLESSDSPLTKAALSQIWSSGVLNAFGY